MTSKVSLYQCISILPKKHLSKILFLLDIEGFPTTYHCLESKFLSSLSSFSFFFKRWKLLLEKFVNIFITLLANDMTVLEIFSTLLTKLLTFFLPYTSNSKENRLQKEFKEYVSLFLLRPSYVSVSGSLSIGHSIFLADAASFPNSYPGKNEKKKNT